MMDAKVVVDEFAAVMTPEDAKVFNEWGDRWIQHWSKTLPFTAPEARGVVWIMFHQQLGGMSVDKETGLLEKPWRADAMQLWNTKYGRHPPQIKFQEA